MMWDVFPFVSFATICDSASYRWKQMKQIFSTLFSKKEMILPSLYSCSFN